MLVKSCYLSYAYEVVICDPRKYLSWSQGHKFYTETLFLVIISPWCSYNSLTNQSRSRFFPVFTNFHSYFKSINGYLHWQAPSPSKVHRQRIVCNESQTIKFIVKALLLLGHNIFFFNKKILIKNYYFNINNYKFLRLAKMDIVHNKSLNNTILILINDKD